MPQDLSDAVSTSLDSDIALIRFDDGKANALSFDVIAAIAGGLADAASSAKAAVVIGREGKFSAGFDLSVMTGGSPDAARDLLAAGARLGLQIYTSPIPVVLGVTGHALAMGGILLTCADYRVGAAGPYKLGLNEVRIGMPVPAFGVELCRDRLRKKWFTRCIQHAHICDPDEALDAGFIDEVVAPDAVEARCLEVAGELAATVHPGPFRMTRNTIRGKLADELEAGLVEDLKLFDISP